MDDIDRFDEHLLAIERAGRDRGRQRDAIRALALFCGARDVESNLRRATHGEALDLQRPWFRFADLTTAALDASRSRTTSRAGAFLILWERSWIPERTQADYAATLLVNCPPPVTARVYLAALDGLRDSPDESLAVENQTDRITTTTMRSVLASLLHDIGHEHVDRATEVRVLHIIENDGRDSIVANRQPVIENLRSLQDFLAARLNRQIADPVELALGAALLVPWSDGSYVAVGLMDGQHGADNLRITAGVLRGVDESDRVRGLEFCNSMTRSNSHYPIFLVGPAGQESILLQQTNPLILMRRNPDFLEHCLVETARVAGLYSRYATEGWEITGVGFEWTTGDVDELLRRSME